MMLCNPWVTGRILWFNQRIIVFLKNANLLQFLVPQEFKIWSGKVDKDEIRLVLALIPEQLLMDTSEAFSCFSLEASYCEGPIADFHRPEAELECLDTTGIV